MANNMMYNLETFGKNLKQCRTEKGFTIESFAELMNVSDRMVRYWEGGENYPKLNKFFEIIVVLETSIDSILQE